MTILKPLPWNPSGRAWQSWVHPARHVTAAGLQIASAALARMAAQVAVPTAAPHQRFGSPPTLEFHAEAGAPEGALYLDGELVGWLTAVRRL